MSRNHYSTSVSPPIAIPVREIAPWLVFALLLLLMIYFVGIEEGATSIFRTCMCTNSCTTAGICSAFPATDERGRDMELSSATSWLSPRWLALSPASA